MRTSSFIVVVFIFSSFISKGQGITDSTSLRKYIEEHAEDFNLSKDVLNDPKYRLQVTFTQVDKNEADTSLQIISFGTHQYFYPASLVKFPIALLALEKMNRLGITMNDYLRIEDVGCGNQSSMLSSRGPTVKFRRLFEELMVVSDNYFYTLLFQFVTPKEINESLKRKGFSGTNIYKSFAGCEKEDQLKCYPMDVLDEDLKIKYSQDYCELDSIDMLENYEYSKDRLFGSKHEDEFVKIVPGPYDLNFSLEIPLDEANEMLIRLMYPKLYHERYQWNLREEDRSLLLEFMQMFPRDMKKSYRPYVLKYDDNKYKYAIVSAHDHLLKTTSKIGLSYGFTSEIVHFEREEHGIEFFLSVSLYTNANDIVNDGDYEYESVARPFIRSLSQILYAYEIEKVEKK